jgi:hypothetical protein
MSHIVVVNSPPTLDLLFFTKLLKKTEEEDGWAQKTMGCDETQFLSFVLFCKLAMSRRGFASKSPTLVVVLLLPMTKMVPPSAAVVSRRNFPCSKAPTIQI